jgi:hypothetical protein
MNIKRRCEELSGKYPEKKKLFENYIKKQRKEYDILEDSIIDSLYDIGYKFKNSYI